MVCFSCGSTQRNGGGDIEVDCRGRFRQTFGVNLSDPQIEGVNVNYSKGLVALIVCTAASAVFTFSYDGNDQVIKHIDFNGRTTVVLF